MKKSKAQRTITTLAGALKGAGDSKQVSRLLRQVAAAGIPHRALAEAGVPDAVGDYVFDASTGRYRRLRSETGGLAVATSLVEMAVGAFGVIERGHSTKIDMRYAGWCGVQAPNIEARSAVPTINRAVSAEEKAVHVRRALAVSSAALATVNAKGSWAMLASGNLGSQSILDVLAAPYPRHPAPHLTEPAAPNWQQYAAGESVAAPLVYRREPLLEVEHGGSPVQRMSPKGVFESRGVANRRMRLFRDTVFAIDPTIADDLMGDAALLEEIHSANGEGASDMIVPAAGFLVVEQDVQIRLVA